jgi:hypothetical protein
MPSEDERTLLNGSYHPSVKGKSIPLGISSPSSPASSSGSKFYDYLDRQFKLTERNTDVGTEVRAGFVTFVTMAYILIVNAEVSYKPQDQCVYQFTYFSNESIVSNTPF